MGLSFVPVQVSSIHKWNGKKAEKFYNSF